MSFGEVYRGRRVLVTGHTGFKGSWLSAWLLKLGAMVTGISKDVPTKPAMFDEIALAGRIKHYQADVRDSPTLAEIISSDPPDFVFHLAAQAIVSAAYSDPVETITTNAIGTLNVLESLRRSSKPCLAVMVTSDKCYDNVESVWGYRESDALGGKDVYSASKGAAELVIKSYVHSFFKNGSPVRVAVGRAGNVIGGGDWARDRLVVDCMRAWSENRPVEIRSPGATRPWQHVLEPLSGYLALGQYLAEGADLQGEAFNFGPRADQSRTVVEVLTDLGRRWGFSKVGDAYRVTANVPFHEAGLLKLNCDKALFHLKWEPNLEYEETIGFVNDWYSAYYHKTRDMYALTMEQITAFEQLAAKRRRTWASR